MKSTIHLTINGRSVTARPGMLLLDLLRQESAAVPSLCYDPRFPPSSACRVCEVRVVGKDRPVTACSTPVEDGMVVETHTQELEHYRRVLLTMLARTYPEQAVRDFPEKPFHKLLKSYGVSGVADSETRERLVDETHPYVCVDMRRCIECYRCVHICDELQGQFVWKILKREAETRIVPDSGTTLLASTCVSCGACVDSCPTGALEDRSRVEQGRAERWERTTCPYCGTGCELNVAVRDDRIVGIRPVMDAPVSKGHLCAKGRYGEGFVDAPDRVTRPMVRRYGEWVPVTWDEALDEAARALGTALREGGSRAVGVLGSARATNEDSYLAQKFARVVLGTNNVDCCARVCHAPSAAGLGRVLGTGAATNSFDDIERTGAFLIVGSNPTENHPIVGARIKQRVLSGAGVGLVVVDPRVTEISRYARVHLRPVPGTNIPLLNAIACVLIEEGLVDRATIDSRTEGFETFAAAVREWSPERAAKICGVEPEAIREAARVYGRAKPAMSFHGLGLTEQIQGTDGVIALTNIALLCGNIGVPGGGVNPLRGQNNVQGTAVMGCEPNKLTGSRKLEAGRADHERVWGVPIPSDPGLDLLQMMDAAGEGKLKSLLVIGYDVFLTDPHAEMTARALSLLDSVIVVDLFMNETAQEFGTIFLPAVSSFEKDGTFMNSERRIQRVRKAIPARGEAQTDSEILCLLAERMGHRQRFSYSGAEEIWDEIRQLWPAVRGMTYARLEQGGLQWPCPSEDHPGTGILHQSGFPDRERAPLVAPDFIPSLEVANAEYPLLLSTGRSLYHFNAATMTGRTRHGELGTDHLLLIHPVDARRYGIRDRQAMRVETRHGAFIGSAIITEDTRQGMVFSTFHRVEALVNRATGDGRDPVTHTPEYKVTAARVRPVVGNG